jgi:hypothetical protein
MLLFDPEDDAAFRFAQDRLGGFSGSRRRPVRCLIRIFKRYSAPDIFA